MENCFLFPSEKESTLEGKNLLPMGANSFLLGQTPFFFFFFFFFLIWVLRPFQEYFTYIEPIVHRRWAKTGVPGRLLFRKDLVYRKANRKFINYLPYKNCRISTKHSHLPHLENMVFKVSLKGTLFESVLHFFFFFFFTRISF